MRISEILKCAKRIRAIKGSTNKPPAKPARPPKAKADSEADGRA